jgi:hypothetical protein
LSLGSDTLLLNATNLRKTGLRLPEIGGSFGANILLSTECCRLGLACFVDSRLFVVRPKPENSAATLEFLRGESFGNYWSRYFFNHTLQTEFGPVDLTRWVDFSYLDYHAPKTGCRDIVDMRRAAQDSVLAALQPTLTVVCRTMLKRQAMLSRTIQSVATASCRSKNLKVNVVLATTQPAAELMRNTVARLQKLAPAVPLRGEIVPLGRRFSRTELMYKYLTTAKSDYVWFVDDDDFIFADSLRHIESAINLEKNNLILGNSIVYDEEWSSPEDPQLGGILKFKKRRDYPAKDFLLALGGENCIPVCSAIFPVGVMRERLAGVRAEGDYFEDYFFLCQAFSAPGLDVRALDRTLAGISLHNHGNTVTKTDRTHWDFSYASFFGEFVNLQRTGNAVLWTAAVKYGALAKAEKQAR